MAEMTSQNHYSDLLTLSDPLKLILLMDPGHYQNRPQPQRSSRRLVGSSSAATPAPPSSSIMAGLAAHKFDQQQPPHRCSNQWLNDTHKKNERSKRHYSKQTHHHAQAQDERSRPDPPECFTPQQQRRHSRKKHSNQPSNRTNSSKMRNRLNNLPLPHEPKPTMIPSHKTDRRQHQQERRRSQSAIDHQDRSHIDIEGKTKNERSQQQCKQWRSHEARAIERPLEDLDDFDHRHPAKSSSFQSHPDQILQVYNDLFKKQLDIKKKSCQDVRIKEENSGGNSISEGSDTSCTTAASTSSEATTADLERRQLQQCGIIISADPSDDESEEDTYCAADTPSKTSEKPSSQGIDNLTSSRSCTDASVSNQGHSSATTTILPRTLKSPTFPLSVDNQLLQRQIKYLQHEPERNNANTMDDDDATPPSSQLIIYPHHQSLLSNDGLKRHFKQIRQRREIISLYDTGRRYSFS